MTSVQAFELWLVKVVGMQAEHRFHPTRRWRFDYALPSMNIAVEIEGATWAGGRHVTGAGYAKDCEKYNEAALLGWTVLRFTSDMIKSGKAEEQVSRALESGG